VSAVAPVVVEESSPFTRKRCALPERGGCGLEKDLDEFYVIRVNGHTQHAVRSPVCKLCYMARNQTYRQARTERLRLNPGPPPPVIPFEPLIRASIARTVAQEPHEETGRTRYLRREQDSARAHVEQELAFAVEAASTAKMALPPFDTTPRCPRADHAWPTERLCRGYEILGCDGLGPHVHRRCMIHAAETTEQAPTFLLSRRSDTVSVTITRLTVRSS
jgi:hypothetical protein